MQFGDNRSGHYTSEYLVADCRYKFARRHNNYQPLSGAACDRVELTLVAPGKDDTGLYEWYIDRNYMSGRLLFDLSTMSKNDFSLLRELRFEDAVCFSLSEHYEIGSSSRRLLKLEFTAESFSIDNQAFELYK